jgi:hypothetical protein
MAINQLLKRMSDFYPPLQSGDLLLCAKHLFVAAMVASVGRKIATRGTVSVTNVTSLVFIFDCIFWSDDTPR